MRSLLIDTNLLCLLAVGKVGEDQVARHKRLTRYDVDDLHRLRFVLAAYDKLIVCPHVLAECSNLLRQTANPLRELAAIRLRAIIGIADEQHLPAQQAIWFSEYPRLGLTDAVLLALLNPETTLSSDDLDLYLAASARGASVINYNHLREGATLAGLGVL
jgi:hypothetical protein